MRINSITMQNWRCFNSEIHLDFNDIEIFSMRNGSGKTSVFTGILYGLYGKVDGTLASYQNHNGQSKVTIEFTHDQNEYKIDREFPTTKAILYQNGSELRNGIREVYDFMDSLVNYKIIKRLWFKGDVSNSDVLNFDFFQNEILSEVLKDPNTVAESLHKDLNAYKKQLRNIEVEEARDPNKIKEEIDELTDKLKERSNIPDSKYKNALIAKENYEEFETFKKNNPNFEPIEKDIIFRWNKIDLYNSQIKLKEEKEKTVDETLSSISQSFLNKVVNENDSHNCCVVCNGNWTEDRSNYIKKLLEEGFQDSSVIKSLEEDISFKRSYNEKIIELSEKYYELESLIPNYDFQSIIDSYNNENDVLWESLDKLNAEYKAAIYNQSKVDESNKLEKQIAECSEKYEVVKEYLRKATASHIDNTFGTASKYLRDFNSRYTNIYVDEESKSLIVDVDSQPLYVNQLSGGEKTLVALSLVVAIRDQYTPGMPLIFDESFAALDAENNEAVIEFLTDSMEQLFVITHNSEWINYANYDMSITNIRREW